MRAPWLLLLALLATPSLARDYHLDPVRGSADGDGSPQNPWRTLDEVVRAGLIQSQHWQSLPHSPDSQLTPTNPGAPIGPGDTLLLHDGDHGRVLIQGAYNSQPITITAAPGAHPRRPGGRQPDRRLLRRRIYEGLNIASLSDTCDG